MSFSSFIEENNITESLAIGTVDFGYINEASFSVKDIEKVSINIGKILGRKLGGELKPIGKEKFKDANGPGIGFRLMNNAGVQIRVNFNSNLASITGSKNITGLSYWAQGNADFERPDLIILFHPLTNIVQVLNQVGESLKARKIVEGLEDTNEALSQKQVKAWLVQQGVPKYLGNPGKEEKLDKKLKDEGLFEEFQLFLGTEEKNSFEQVTLQKASKMMKEVRYADPEFVFQDMEQLVQVVAKKKWKSLVVCGAAGVGKTWGITNPSAPYGLPTVLGPEGGKWALYTGMKASPLAFYKTMFQERDKIVVLDEADNILKNDEIVIMLKAMLDTDGDNYASYTTGTTPMIGKSKAEIEEHAAFVDSEIASGAEIIFQGKEKSGMTKLPSKFAFTGGIIFISNMPAAKIDTAVMSRSIFVDIHLAEQDRLKRVQTIGKKMAEDDPEISAKDLEDIMKSLGSAAPVSPEAVKYITPEYARQSKEISLRAMSLSFAIKKAGLKDSDRLIAMYT